MRPGPKGSAGTTCTEDLQPGIRQPRKPAARKQDLRCSDTVSVRIPTHKTVPKRPHSAPRERGCRGERIQFRACHTLHRAGLRGAFLTEVPAHRCFPESVAASPRSAPPSRQPISSIPRQHSAPARHKKGPQTSVRGLGSGSLPLQEVTPCLPSWRQPPWRSSEQPGRRCHPASSSQPKR